MNRQRQRVRRAAPHPLSHDQPRGNSTRHLKVIGEQPELSGAPAPSGQGLRGSWPCAPGSPPPVPHNP
eukprot:2094035-Rhodomonas_salina.1